MKDISQRIKWLVDDYCDNNVSKFALMMGSSEANIRNYISGTQPKYEFLSKVIETFEINAEWLLTGKGDMLKSGDNEPAQPYACRECKKKDKEIEKWKNRYIELSDKYIALSEEIKDKKVS